MLRHSHILFLLYPLCTEYTGGVLLFGMRAVDEGEFGTHETSVPVYMLSQATSHFMKEHDLTTYNLFAYNVHTLDQRPMLLSYSLHQCEQEN